MERLYNRYDVLLELLALKQRCVVIKDQRINALRVLKIMGKDCPLNSAARMANEVVVASQMNHPNLCKTFHVDQADDGTTYVISEYVAGPDMDQVLKICGKLPEMAVVAFACQLLSAIREMNDRGFIHKDVKPSNIVLDAGWQPSEHRAFLEAFRSGDVSNYKNALLKRMQNPSIKLIDFGLSQSRDCRSMSYAGTRLYSSPEQLLCMTVDGRSDIFSAGVTIYRLATGRYPHLSDEDLAIASGNPEYIIKKAERGFSIEPIEGISDKLNAIIKKMLTTRKDQRYSNMSEVISDLKAVKEPALSETLEYKDANESACSGSGWIQSTEGAECSTVIAGEVDDDNFDPVGHRHHEIKNMLSSFVLVAVAAVLIYALPQSIGRPLPVLPASAVLGLIVFFFVYLKGLWNGDTIDAVLWGIIFGAIAMICAKVPELILKEIKPQSDLLGFTLLASAASLWVLSITYQYAGSERSDV